MSQRTKRKSRALVQPNDAPTKLVMLALVAILLFAAGTRIRLLDTPLERDEGEYAYAGQLILQGVAPYQHVYNMKLPGIYAAYAVVIAVFGQTQTGVHTGLLVINAVTILLVFLLGRRLLGAPGALAAAGAFAVLSVTPALQGVFANAEHFVVLFAVGGLLILMHAEDSKRTWLFFLSGLMLGVGFLMKQHGAAFVALGGIVIVLEAIKERPVRWRETVWRCGLFVAGAGLPYGLVCVVLAAAGVFDAFWFWTVEYAGAYVAQVPLTQAWQVFLNRAGPIFASAPLLWLSACGGLAVLILSRRFRPRSRFVVPFAVFSLLSIVPGFFFRPHYFVLLLPAAAILVGVATEALVGAVSNAPSWGIRIGVPVTLVVVFLAQPVILQWDFLYRLSPEQACRSVYGLNPFPESLEISRLIRQRTGPDDRIAVIGSEPQIYFYSGRRSASGYIYTYPLMENHDFALEMQEQMIEEIEAAEPSMLVYVNITSSWLQRPESHQRLLGWFNDYLPEHYEPVMVAEMFNDRTVYHEPPELQVPPGSPYWIGVFERTGPGAGPGPGSS